MFNCRCFDSDISHHSCCPLRFNALTILRASVKHRNTRSIGAIAPVPSQSLNPRHSRSYTRSGLEGTFNGRCFDTDHSCHRLLPSRFNALTITRASENGKNACDESYHHSHHWGITSSPNRTPIIIVVTIPGTIFVS